MARTNMDGKSIKLVLRWLLNREELQDAEIATATGLTASTYSRRKDSEDFPSFEDLEKIGQHFGISARMLQIAFGLRDLSELVILEDGEMRQYIEQGGANHPHHPLLVGARREERHQGRREVLILTPAMIKGREIRRVKSAPTETVQPWVGKPSA
jgi:transcriptional regulator with XRE-family HTH domain